MLKHADGDNAVKLSFDLAVVPDIDVHGQVSAAIAGQFCLLHRNGDPGDVNTIVPGHPAGQTAPAAADIQHRHPGLKLQLGTDHLHFGNLRLVKTAGAFPKPAAVIHVGIEHLFKDIVTDVVVLFADLKGPCAALTVK